MVGQGLSAAANSRQVHFDCHYYYKFCDAELIANSSGLCDSQIGLSLWFADKFV